VTDNSAACTAYSRYCLDIGTSEDWFALQISLLPCLLGYNVIAERLKKEQKEGQQNPYRTWIENYTGADYVEAVEKGCGKSSW
jgi:thiaminase